jgi:hypothetical protein
MPFLLAFTLFLGQLTNFRFVNSRDSLPSLQLRAYRKAKAGLVTRLFCSMETSQRCQARHAHNDPAPKQQHKLRRDTSMSAYERERLLARAAITAPGLCC